MTKHRYYDEDTEQRKNYFEKQFFRLAGTKELNKISDFDSFKKVLNRAFSKDASLSAYLEGMSENALIMFYDRSNIRKIVEGNSGEIQENIPIEVHQVDKKVREFFVGFRRGQRTTGYKDSVKIGTRKQTVYRDSRGRFVSVK